MRLVVVTSDPEGPVVRHRVARLHGDLEAVGFEGVTLEAIPKRLRDRIALFRRLRDADLVVLSRRLFQGVALRALRSSAQRLVYDVDDAVLYRDPWRGRPESRVRTRRFRRTVREADAVTAGCPVLRDLAQELAPDTPVHLAPTPIDTDHFVPGPRDIGPPRIGWIGSRATRPYLKALAGPLREVANAYPKLRIAVMADEPPLGLDDLPVDFTPWSLVAEVPFLQSLDVGLMPLSDDPFSRGKCGFKLLQYMACGVASVASPVGVNVDILSDGAGLLAAEDAAWVGALSDLLDNPERRAEMASTARVQAEELWSSRVLGPRFAAVLKSVVDR